MFKAITAIFLPFDDYCIYNYWFEGYKMKKRVGAVEEFKFEPLVVIGKQLHITLAVTGWLSKDMPGQYSITSVILACFPYFVQLKL